MSRKVRVGVRSLVAFAVLFSTAAARADEKLDAEIHEALLRHPEWLAEMARTLQTQKELAREKVASKAIDENKIEIFNNPADPTIGNPQGNVTIVVFQDKQCPFCKAVAPDLERLSAEDTGVRIVFKEFPILGGGSVVAARAALASKNQGKFADFNKRLFGDQTPEHQLTERHVFEIAAASKLNASRLRRDMADPSIEQTIAANKALAAKLGISGTPAIIIGDRLYPGVVSLAALKKAVSEIRSKHPS